MTKSAGAHGAVGHDRGVFNLLGMASQAFADGDGFLMIGCETQFWGGLQKFVAQSENGDESYHRHHPEEVSLSGILFPFCHDYFCASVVLGSGDGYGVDFYPGTFG